MRNQSPVKFRICPESDKPGVVDFLYSIRDELYFSERRAAEEIAELMFAQGGFFAGYVQEEIVAVTGYVFGEPGRDEGNKKIGFIHVAGLAKPYRGTAAFRTGLRFAMETLQALGVEEVRFHALETDARLNGLYGSFAQPLRKELNRRGFPCVLYGSAIADVLVALAGRKKRRRRYDMPPAGRPLVTSINGAHLSP